MQGMDFRISEFIRPGDHRSLVVDASAGMSLGALPGLEDFPTAVGPLLKQVDGLVCGPGQLQRLQGGTKQDAGLLARLDWTNTLRDQSFVLPVEKNEQFLLYSARDALDFGASGMVISFLLGYDEEIEAACLKATVTLALEGKEAGIPLVVEVRPSGSRVSLYGKAVELGASYALEGGADVIVLPYPGSASLKTISQFVSVPWLLKPSGIDAAQREMEEALAVGGAGVWLDHTLFAQADPPGIISALREALHLAVER